MKRYAVLAMVMAVLPLAGCPIQTENKVILQQEGKIQVDLNVSTINIVVTDSRKDMQQITGEAPARVVSPEDIGLPAAPPPAPKPGAMLPQSPAAAEGYAMSPSDLSPALTLAVAASPEDQLKNNISGRVPQVRYLLDTHLVGEGHSGLLAVPNAATKLTPQQQAILTAENSDRTALYALQAKTKSSAVADVALSYYLARLGYAKSGDLIEQYNKQSKAWEWTTWK